jgi:hypothetical protein
MSASKQDLQCQVTKMFQRVPMYFLAVSVGSGDHAGRSGAKTIENDVLKAALDSVQRFVLDDQVGVVCAANGTTAFL